MRQRSTSLVCLVLLTLATLFAAPAAFADKGGDETEVKQPATALFAPSVLESALGENNCTWSCSDGRTGGAEVNTEKQCADACAGACGEPCIAESDSDSIT